MGGKFYYKTNKISHRMCFDESMFQDTWSSNDFLDVKLLFFLILYEQKH